WYNCDYPDSVDYVKSCENGVMYDRFDQVVNESSAGHYTLDPQEPYYTFVCADSTNCTKYSTQIKFMDIIQIPASTSNNLTGMYNREENPCCFIDLSEAECDGETPLTFGQEIQVYDMNADFLYQTNLELYGGTVLVFRFCPPQCDTASNVINNWYSIVIRNDECSFCRMDFMCDSISDPEPFVILNYPSGKPKDNLGLFEGKSANNGPIIKPVKPQKLPPSISIYPNPTQSEVNVKIVSVNSANITVNITDMAGKSVYKNSYKTTNNQLTTSINLSELVSGIYTVYIPELNYYYKLVIIK
ncbi:MAG: T9SS type A sorting domain-containing protein, partial [Chitinophagaceae bacterium]